LENENEYEYYNVKIILNRLKRFEKARVNGDIKRMLYLIRTEFSRRLKDMSNLLLYKYSYIGINNLINRYINTVLFTLNKLLEILVKSYYNTIESKFISVRRIFRKNILLLSNKTIFDMKYIRILKIL
jgi:TAG lipase/steryl ester hydrolase/phospholipase A2/LPA acyltransferase